jgi:hypothetical protein
MGRLRVTAMVVLASSVLLSSRASASSVGTVPDDGCLSYAGAIFCDADLRSTGTGVFDPFLRTNGGGGEPVTSGWNTDADGSLTQPNMADLSQTSALAVGDIGTSTGGGTTYWTFVVDINQSKTSSLLDLTHLEMYSCGTATYTDLSACSSFYNLFGGTVTYDSNGKPVISDSSWITFNYANHTGSGSGDILVFIPTDGSFPTTGFVALLDGWGMPPGTNPDNDGFQEWAGAKDFECPSGCGSGSGSGSGSSAGQGPEVPEPASLFLLGSGVAMLARRVRSKKQ